MKENRYEVIIVGTGVAGLFAALSLPKDCSILMITKEEADISDSYLAQGGISTLLMQEDYEDYYNDTLKAGRYQNNPESVKEMISSSKDVIETLLEYGVEFDKTAQGDFEYTREGGHSTYRILHHQDVTGKEIVEKLLKEAKSRSNITIAEYTVMVDILTEQGECAGIVAKRNNEWIACRAKAVFLATGGVGGIFKSSTNFSQITGDGIALALRHNVAVANMNYIQIHPTVLYSKKKGRRFLISESVRGEGAILLNEEKKRFVNELLPRDLLTEAIQEEMEKYHTEYVYLSMENISREKIKNHFPNIYARCKEEGYDAFTDLIPVTPAQHYLMGGIKTDIYARTSMKRLYAVGETACNGVHGANRLASNSLLESLVFSRNAVRHFIEEERADRILGVSKELDLQCYENEAKWTLENKALLLGEIKRRDEKFYDKWCKFKG
ncbi:L-aspartate oxidase [Konateibacter massiliensis]|uniref:L-aspartate oxidase n=1 Tax=Konateibacter massiliensis TaxID=2002841 RepID=UPI000C144F1D|nr:L-aspartate oxidase [Konateibacter massiliensis]